MLQPRLYLSELPLQPHRGTWGIFNEAVAFPKDSILIGKRFIQDSVDSGVLLEMFFSLNAQRYYMKVNGYACSLLIQRSLF